MRILLQKSSFNLDVSGIAGFFGGEESFAAMSSVHLVRGRRWLGWYNSPGSYFVAKKYGTLAQSRFWDGLFPGPNVDPATMLELDGKSGPRYTGVFSGNRFSATGHLSFLLARYCELSVKPSPSPIPSSDTSPRSNISLTIVQLGNFKEFKGYPTVPEDFFLPFDPVGILPIAFSIGCAIVTGIFRDWYIFAMILLGVVCNGITCYVLASGSLELDCPVPSANSPPGDGILVSPRGIIVLQGDERSVSSVIRGAYNLRYESEPKYRNIGFSSLTLTAQFLLQLFLVPQGGLFGQIMFLSTLAVSWMFNAYLASLDREKLQTGILLKVLGRPKAVKFSLDRWSTAVAFVAFYLKPKDARGILDELIPNNTPAWRIWKDRVVVAIEKDTDPVLVKTWAEDGRDSIETLDSSDRKFVLEFLQLAREAYNGAKRFRSTSHADPIEDKNSVRIENIPVREKGPGKGEKRGFRGLLP